MPLVIEAWCFPHPDEVASVFFKVVSEVTSYSFEVNQIFYY